MSTENRIVFVQPHLRFGGAEKQTALILNSLVDSGNSCTLILHRKEGGLLNTLDPRIRIIDLGFQSHLRIPFGVLKLANILREIEPSVIVARLWSSILTVGIAKRFAPQHNYFFYEDLDPRNHTDYIRFGKIKKSLVKRVFNQNYDKLIANTEHVSTAMCEEYSIPSKPQVIECGIDTSECRGLALASPAAPISDSRDFLRIVTVGSLTERKGITQLFNILKEMTIPIHWTLVGQGPLRDTLLHESRSENGNLTVSIIDGTDNPYPYIASSDLLLHGALSESFGIVLVEAIALGVPVIANAANGPAEIKRQLPNAEVSLLWLEREPEELASLLQRYYRDMDVRQRRFTADLGPYELSVVLEKWRSLMS
ncbi:glycosyltransferase [Changpingibacter yushuensis]|uniref:glycosyltransferase n=1 Tax=Changpingibacter yushuensis TaxID=2758440 RepID=UPI0015F4887F|nr:glycosyltransferase [Changpingibacter yushuensis]